MPKGVSLSYQDDKCVGLTILENDINLDNVNKCSQNEITVDAVVVEGILREREEGEEADCSEDEADQTIWQYANEIEEGPVATEPGDDSEDD
jgi:hypothetical protein